MAKLTDEECYYIIMALASSFDGPALIVLSEVPKWGSLISYEDLWERIEKGFWERTAWSADPYQIAKLKIIKSALKFAFEHPEDALEIAGDE